MATKKKDDFWQKVHKEVMPILKSDEKERFEEFLHSDNPEGIAWLLIAHAIPNMSPRRMAKDWGISEAAAIFISSFLVTGGLGMMLEDK